MNRNSCRAIAIARLTGRRPPVDLSLSRLAIDTSLLLISLLLLTTGSRNLMQQQRYSISSNQRSYELTIPSITKPAAICLGVEPDRI